MTELKALEVWGVEMNILREFIKIQRAMGLPDLMELDITEANLKPIIENSKVQPLFFAGTISWALVTKSGISLLLAKKVGVERQLMAIYLVPNDSIKGILEMDWDSSNRSIHQLRAELSSVTAFNIKEDDQFPLMPRLDYLFAEAADNAWFNRPNGESQKRGNYEAN